MSILDMIAEWEKGCSNTLYNGEAPEYCPECTRELITAIKREMSSGRYFRIAEPFPMKFDSAEKHE